MSILTTAKIIREEKLNNGTVLILVDLTSIGKYPKFALYKKRMDDIQFIQGHNERLVLEQILNERLNYFSQKH